MNKFYKKLRFTLLIISIVIIIISLIWIFLRINGFVFQSVFVNRIFSLLTDLLPFSLVSFTLYIRHKKLKLAIFILYFILIGLVQSGIYWFNVSTGWFDNIKFKEKAVYEKVISETKKIKIVNSRMNNNNLPSDDLHYLLEESFIVLKKVTFIPNELIFWNNNTDSIEITINDNKHVVPNPIETHKISQKENK